jgi:hypothetical protein
VKQMIQPLMVKDINIPNRLPAAFGFGIHVALVFSMPAVPSQVRRWASNEPGMNAGK